VISITFSIRVSVVVLTFAKLGVGGPVGSGAPVRAPEPSSGSHSYTPGILVESVGLVSIIAGSVFGILSTSAWGSAKSACGGDPSHCADVAATSWHVVPGVLPRQAGLVLAGGF
jgi:hypothetical protein